MTEQPNETQRSYYKNIESSDAKILMLFLADSEGTLTPEECAYRLNLTPEQWESQKRSVLDALEGDKWSVICNLCEEKVWEDQAYGALIPVDPKQPLKMVKAIRSEAHICKRCLMTFAMGFVKNLDRISDEHEKEAKEKQEPRVLDHSLEDTEGDSVLLRLWLDKEKLDALHKESTKDRDPLTDPVTSRDNFEKALLSVFLDLANSGGLSNKINQKLKEMEGESE